MEDDGTRREPTVNASRRRRRLLLARAEKTSPIPREGKRDKSAGAQGAYSLSNEPGTGRGKRRVVVRQSRDHGNRNANIPLPRAPSTPNRPHHCAPSSPACARTRRHRPQRDPSSLKIRENASFSCTFSRKWCPGGGNGGETTVWVPTPCSCVLGPLGDVVRARRGDLRRVPRGRLGSKARVLQRGGRARRMTAACLELGSDSRSVRELGSEFPLAAIESKGGLRARRRARRERTIARAAAALCPSGARSPGTGGRGYGRATSTDATARPKHLETSAFPRR